MRVQTLGKRALGQVCLPVLDEAPGSWPGLGERWLLSERTGQLAGLQDAGPPRHALGGLRSSQAHGPDMPMR